MPQGIGSLLGGFADAYSDDLTDHRKRQREAEDAELKERRLILGKLIDGMQDNPANTELVNRALQDYLAIGQAQGSRKPAKKFSDAMAGKSELPVLPFLDAIARGEVSTFGSIPRSGAGATGAQKPQPAPAEQEKQGAAQPQPQSTGPMPAGGGMMPGLPLPPNPPGTGRMAKAAGVAASEAPAPPTQTQGSPGLYLAGPDRARLAGMMVGEKERAEWGSRAELMREYGGTDEQITRMMMGTAGRPGSVQSQSDYYSPRGFIGSNGERFVGFPDKMGRGVWNPATREFDAGAQLDPGWQTGMAYDDTGAATAYRIPKRPDAGAVDTEPVPSLRGRTTPPVVIADEESPTGRTYTGRASAPGQSAPAPAGQTPPGLDPKAKAAAEEQLKGELEKNRQWFASGEDGQLGSWTRAREYARRDAAATARYRAGIGHPQTNEQEIYQALAKERGIPDEGGTSIPAPPVPPAPAAPAPVSAATGRTWAATKGLPNIPAGTAPNWNPAAIQRMREYLTEKASAQGVQITDEIIATAMTKIQRRMDAGIQ